METPAVTDPIPFRNLLDEAMRRTRRHFGELYLWVAIPLAVVAVVVQMLQTRFALLYSGARAADFSQITSGCAGFIAAVCATVFVQGLTHAVLTSAATDAVSGRPIDVPARWRFVLRLDTLATLLLAFLAVVAGCILLVLPGLYVALMLGFVVPVMAVEGARGPAALGRSWRLMRYNPHRRFLDNPSVKVFLLYLVAGLIGYAVGALVQLPFSLAMGLNVMRNAAAGRMTDTQALLASTLWLRVGSSVLGSLVSTAVGIYTSFGVVLLYFDVVRRKEGTDLAAAIETRFAPGDAAPPPPTSGAAV